MAPPPCSRPRRSLTRRSLAACTGEGAAAEVVGACCGGAALTGWALYLGMSAKLVGMMAALPVVAQLVQGAAAYFTVRYGHRRTALLSVALSRQAFWPLVFLPILPLGPEGRRTVLVVVAGVHHGLGMVANNAWNSWMGELVPPALRGRYFGRRTALCTVAGGLCALAAGLALDRGLSRGSGGRVLEGLALVACLAGAASAFLMSRQHARPRRGDEVCFSLGAMVRPFADRRARGLLAYTVAWYGACGLSAPFFGLYLLRDLGLGYGQLAAQGAGLALAKVASTSRFGRVVDRLGSRRVLLACTAGLAASPVAWIASTAGHAWPLVVETAVGGVLLGGHAVASFALPLEVAPPRERPLYLAAVAVAGGAAFAATSALGGAVAGAAAVASLRPILAGSAGLRLVAVLAALALPRRGGALRAANGPGEPAAKAEPVRRAA